MDVNHEQDYRWVRDVRAALLAGELVEPPEWVRERARRLFQTHGPHPAPTFLERVRATLVFDSRRTGISPVGVRSSLAGVLDGPWQLLFRGGDVDVDLLVRPNQDGRTLSVRGQALALSGGSIGVGVVEATPTDAPHTLYGAAMPAARTELDSSGEFSLSNLERGRYDVLLRFGAREIELSDLEL